MARKLAAILAADIVGYSGLMEADEAGTFEQCTAESGFDLVLRLADQVVISTSVDFGEVKKPTPADAFKPQRRSALRPPVFPESQRDDDALAMNSATTSG
jgi:hypothetical protein